MADIGLFEAIHSQRAIRKFMTDAIPQDLMKKVLDAAIRAPSPINDQSWRFIVVSDASRRQKICDIYSEVWTGGQSTPQAQEYMKTKDQSVVGHASAFATGGIRKAPAFIFVCGVGGSQLDSTLMAAQNVMLAARGLGLGTVFTTLIAKHPDLRGLLQLPEGAEVACMIPIGYPDAKFGPTRRLPVEQVTFAEKWGTPLT